MHVAGRALGWVAEVMSAITAFVVVVHPQAATGPVATPTNDTDVVVSWFLRGLLGVSLALNTYFLKKLSDNVASCTDIGNKHETRIAVLERSYDLWMEYERDQNPDFNRRDRAPGRRAADMVRGLNKKNTGNDD